MRRNTEHDKVCSVNTAHSAHMHGYQHITKYTQLTAVATNTFLSTLSVQPCMHPHTTLCPPNVYSYALPATYIPTCSSIRDNSNDHLWLKSVQVTKQIFTRSQKPACTRFLNHPPIQGIKALAKHLVQKSQWLQLRGCSTIF